MNPNNNHALISAVLNTYNAGDMLEDTLKSLQGFDEIVVCDMESTDDTLAIAKKYGCKIVTFPKGNYNICEPARNTAIQSASHEWVLIVDADEIVPQKLVDYLYDWVKTNQTYSALFLPRKNHILYSFDSSSYPDYQCRFVKKSCTDWPPTIHAKPKIDGACEYIPQNRKDLALIHASESLSSYYFKMCRYTDNEVARRKGKRTTLLKLMFEPLFRFIKSYFIKGGIFDGKVGYIKAQQSCFYRFMVMSKLYEYYLLEEKKKEQH